MSTTEVNPANVNTESLDTALQHALTETLYFMAMDIVSSERQVSVSLLADRLGISAGTAVELVDRMEEEKLIGPATDGQPREIYSALGSQLLAAALDPGHTPQTPFDEVAGLPSAEDLNAIAAMPAELRSSSLTILPADEEVTADDNWCPECGHPRDACRCAKEKGAGADASATPAKPEEIRMIVRSKLFPSPTNPRKSFPVAGLEELAASIKEQGLISPLVVRWAPGKDGSELYEIVAGERRYRALGILETPDAPCIVRNLSNQQVVEIQLIENLQRVDVHPMEEAAGYAQIMAIRGHIEAKHGQTDDDHKHSVKYIAKAVGKSMSYVWQRLKLLALSTAVAEAFRNGELSPSHAIDCARLEPDDQADYLRVFRDSTRNGYGFSVRHMRDWIDKHVRIDLTRAPFKLNDAGLVPGVVACTGCTKCSLGQPELFEGLTDRQDDEQQHKRKKGEKKSAVCMDRGCYQQKLDAHVEIRAASIADEYGQDIGDVLRVYGGEYYERDDNQQNLLPKAGYTHTGYIEVKDKEYCGHATLAVIAAGKGIGEKKWVCIDTRCPVHGKEIKGSSTSGSSTNDEERRRRKAAELEKRVRAAAMATILQGSRKAARAEKKLLTDADLRVVTFYAFDRLGNDVLVPVCKMLKWEATQRPQDTYAHLMHTVEDKVMSLSRGRLAQLLLLCAMASELRVNTYSKIEDPRTLGPIAERYGVDLAEMRKLMAPPNKKAKKKAAATAAGGL